MRLNLLCDASWESGVGKLLAELSSTGYRSFFAARDYGTGLAGVTVVFVCQEPSLALRRRVRFAKDEKKVYLDIMLDLDQMKRSDHGVRRRIATDRLADEVPAVLHHCSIPKFDEVRFVEDLRNWLKEIG